jgi:hypothetical protein
MKKAGKLFFTNSLSHYIFQVISGYIALKIECLNREKKLPLPAGRSFKWMSLFLFHSLCFFLEKRRNNLIRSSTYVSFKVERKGPLSIFKIFNQLSNEKRAFIAHFNIFFMFK